MRESFLELSPWVEWPQDVAPTLTQDLQTDVVIVGAGYTGLSTALSLGSEGVNVVVLERDFAGAGASGANAGHLTPTIGKDLPTLIRLFGRRRASALLRFADQAVAYTEGLIQKCGVDCDYLPSGNVMAAVHPKHASRLRWAAELGAEFGVGVRFLAEGEMRDRGLPGAFCCGVLEEKGGTLAPGRYVTGLRRAALEAGVTLHERTPVRAIEDGAKVRVRTDGGTVTADNAVIATNAYTPTVGRKTRAVVPLRVSLFETEPLGDERLAALGWAGKEGIYTTHEVLESYRLTAKGTLIGGSKTVRYAYGSKFAPGHDPKAFRTIERAFRDRFPQLTDVRVAHFWGGWIAMPLDFLPSIGVTGRSRNVHFGLGYAGHGVAQATLMGRMLAEQIQGREHPSAAALKRHVWAWPVEPFRWMVFQAVNGVLNALDARTDRQIRKLGRHT
jgi:gamma-glutamylputrescine oxidase